MMKRLNTYNLFDIVVVPFPFTDLLESKKRPAIVISSYGDFSAQSNHYVLAMITSGNMSSWPLDVEIKDLINCGLLKTSKIRLKIFTLDARLIYRKIGTLTLNDQIQFRKNFGSLFSGCLQ